MLVFLSNLILLFAEHGGGGTTDPDSNWGRFLEFWNTYLNYPGFEAWRFINLAIFVGILIYILKKPLSEAFKAKRESIREELIRAEAERQAALGELADVEAKLEKLDTEKTQVIHNAEAEAEAERIRLANETESDVNRIRGQAESEIERKAQQVRLQLKRYSAEESIRRAEEKIKAAMNNQTDAELVKANVQSIGGIN